MNISPRITSAVVGVSFLLGSVAMALQLPGDPLVMSYVNPPTLTTLSVTMTTATTARVQWDTNSPSNSKAYYSEAEAIAIFASSSKVIDTALVYHHAVDLSGLIPSTRYVVSTESMDAKGSVGASNQASFTTGR